MALDPSIALSAPQVPPVDVAGAVSKGLNLRMLMEKSAMNQQLLEQQLASERAAQLSTEEGTRAGVQKREEDARQIEASKTVAGLYKDKRFLKPDGKVDHDGIYEAALTQGVPIEKLTDLRTKVQTVRDADLKDQESRHAATQKLLRQLDMEVPKSLSVDDTKGLISTKMKELVKLGMTQEEAQKELTNRFGPDIENAPRFAQARLNAEMTPLKSAELTIAQAQLGIAQADEARRKREEVRTVAGGMAGVDSSITDLDKAIGGLDKLNKQFPTKLGTMLSQGWDKLVSQPGELGQVARVAQAYEKRTGQKLDINALGYDGVRAALAGEKGFYEGQKKALGAGAPPGVPPAAAPAPQGKMVTVVRKSDGKIAQMPEDRAAALIATGKFTRGSK